MNTLYHFSRHFSNNIFHQIFTPRTLKLLTYTFAGTFLFVLFSLEWITGHNSKEISGIVPFLQIITGVFLVPAFFLAIATTRYYRNIVVVAPLIILATTYYTMYLITSLYRLIMMGSLDIYFVWFNRYEIINTVANTMGGPFIWLVLFLVVIYLTYALTTIFNHIVTYTTSYQHKTRLSIISIIFVIATMCLGFVGTSTHKPEIYRFVEHILVKRNNNIESIYLRAYLDNIQSQSSIHAHATRTPDVNFIILHLESLNANAVNNTTTPVMIRAAQNGILIPTMISQTVNTIRAEEMIYCSVLPSPSDTIINRRNLTTPECLPRVLANNGYNTYFFKSDDLAFSHSGDFAISAGFDYALREDMMQNGDPETTWGFREDVFYQRIEEYMKDKIDDPFFAYISVSSTNHYPYDISTTFHDFPSDALPFPENTTNLDTYHNAVFLQDHYLQTALDWIERSGLRKNSYVMITGDHPSPITPSDDTVLFEHNATERHFITSAVFIPPTDVAETFPIGTTYDHYFSHSDIMPTFLDLAGITHDPVLGTSYVTHLKNNTAEDRCLVSVQPFGDRFLSLVEYPRKTLFNIFQGTVETFDLSTDAEGLHALTKKDIEPSDTDIVTKCLATNF